MTIVLSLDSETTGIDHHHGARPFIVTTCADNGQQRWWQWDVDPLTRMPTIPGDDISAIQDCMNNADTLVLQNSKFDAAALTSIGVVFPWHKVMDTLMAGHLLASNHRHNLTDMCIEYLGHDIEPMEVAVEKATKEARRLVKKQFSDWRIAEEGDPMLPSIKSSSKRDEDKPWKNDMWLCRVLWTLGIAEDPTWETVCSDYANTDSAVTLPLWNFMEKEIKRRGLWKIYLERLKLLPIAFGMEQRGVTASGTNTEKLIKDYSVEVETAKSTLLSIATAHGHDLELPNGASPNDSLREMFFGSTRLTCPRCGTEKRYKEWSEPTAPEGTLCAKCEKKGVFIQCNVARNLCLDLPKQYNPASKSTSPTLDKSAMDHYESTLDAGPALEFVRSLKGMRSRQTAISYASSYKKFWLPVAEYAVKNPKMEMHNWFRLYPSVNPVGTDTLRWSSNNPNSQNISKKESFNLRRCFGPMPGREWWSMDGKNLELRIPAYESGESELIKVFDHPDDPPYYGSYHLVVFDALHPQLFAQHGKAVKEMFESTWYQWIKNGNFAVIYGCQEKKADQTYHVLGAYKMLRDRFPNIAKLSDKQKALGNKYGYVETIPDREVDPERGYPILCGRTEDGRISPTTTLNYHISGSAMQWTNTAMVLTEQQVREWNDDGWDGFLTLQVHDELVWDCPKGTGVEPWRTNLPRMKRLAALMESCGDRIGVPTPVSREYHSDTWATGIVV